MLLTLGIGAALASLGVANYAAREVNNDLSNELNSINSEIQKMIEKAEKNVESTQKGFEKSLNRLYSLRKKIYKDTLIPFDECAKRIKNPDLKKANIDQQKIESFENNMITYKNNSVWVSGVPETVSTVLTTIALGGAGLGLSLVGQIGKGISLEYKIDDAKAEKAKVKAECAKVNAKCTKIKGITRFCKSTYSTLDTLKKLEDEYVRQVNEIIDINGEEYASYSETEKDIVMTMYNIGFALNDLLSVKIINKNGSVNKRFSKYMGEADSLLGE